MNKKYLNALPLHDDFQKYYDESKAIYSTSPVFPFIDESEIKDVLDDYIDSKKLREEVQNILAKALEDNAVIEDSEFVIGLLDWNTFPELIKMLTVIREWAFRNEGGGVGGLDEDSYDHEPEMMQLIILNPNYEDLEGLIVGGYRYMIHHYESYERGPMGDHYVFSEDFKRDTWIELGRSFINPYYTERDRKKSFDYVLHGLGYIYAKNSNACGYFGKVTLYNIYEKTGADKFFLAVAKNYFNNSNLLHVKESERVQEGTLSDQQKEVLNNDIFKGLFLLLRKEYHVNIVPIMAVYNRMVDLSDMHYFGAFRHQEFGNSTEVGIAINFDDIYDIIKEKFAQQYV